MNDVSDDSVIWVQQLVGGDDDVFQEFWQRYGDRLQRLAEHRMTPRLRQRVGPDDVVQSVCRTFVRRSKQGEFHLPDTDSLWRLLCAITLTKVRQHGRFHYRQRRNVRREVAQHDDSNLNADPVDARYPGTDPTPQDVVAFADQMEQLLSALGDEERSLVQLKLDGHKQEEIAQKLGCSERTVRRLLSRVRSQWKALLDDSLN